MNDSRRRRDFLTDAFSVKMIEKYPVSVLVQELDDIGFCSLINLSYNEGNLVNALRYSMSAKVVNELCEVPVQKNKIEIKARKHDEFFVILTNGRLDGAEALNEKTADELCRRGLIKFYRLIVV